MPDPDDIDDVIDSEITKPASTSIEGNSVARRPLGELLDAKRQAAADQAAQSTSGGVRRTQFRNRGPAGGPT